MPVYEFACRSCKKNFEITQSISRFDAGKVKCPKCRSKKVERVWSRVFTVTSKKS